MTTRIGCHGDVENIQVKFVISIGIVIEMFQSTSKDQDLRGDNEVKLIRTSIDLVETNFGRICSSFGTFAAKTALVRDSGDDLSRRLKEYAAMETLCKSLRTKLSTFADCLISVEDYRQATVDRLEAKVIGQLSQYKQLCKSAKDNVKNAVRANDKRIERQRNLQKLRSKLPINRQEIAEAEFTQAKVEAGKGMNDLTDSMQKFQHKKLKDIKQILLNYTKTELIFHAKALELYTQAFTQISQIDEDDDLQVSMIR
ncbi:hypothetical protein CHUAL_003434 [Chamberlinius hualienensis]